MLLYMKEYFKINSTMCNTFILNSACNEADVIINRFILFLLGIVAFCIILSIIKCLIKKAICSICDSNA